MRAYGLDKVRGLVRRHTQLANDLESMINKDDRYRLRHCCCMYTSSTPKSFVVLFAVQQQYHVSSSFLFFFGFVRSVHRVHSTLIAAFFAISYVCMCTPATRYQKELRVTAVRQKEEVGESAPTPILRLPRCSSTSWWRFGIVCTTCHTIPYRIM